MRMGYCRLKANNFESITDEAFVRLDRGRVSAAILVVDSLVTRCEIKC